jgi:hypothetical protein
MRSAAVMLRLLPLLPLLAAPTRAIDPAYAQNLTVFHINPREEGPYPLNMDTADAAGDLFFDLFEVRCVAGPAADS